MADFGIIGMGKMGHAISDLLEADKKVTFHTFNRLSDDNQHLLEACKVVIEFTVINVSITFCVILRSKYKIKYALVRNLRR